MSRARGTKTAVLAALAVLTIAAAPGETSLRDRLVVEAAALPPAMLAFDRTLVSTQSGTGNGTTETRLDRWDGRGWKAVSVNGKPRTPDDAAKALKVCPSNPVPGYYRLAALLAHATQATDTQGRTVLRGSVPANWITSSCKDISEHFTFEAIVASGAPYVEKVRLTTRAPFRMSLMAKIDSFVSTSDYARDVAGRPRLVRQVADVGGSILGISGVQHNEGTFNYP